MELEENKSEAKQILAFYQKLGRPLTAIEIGKATHNTPFDEVLRELGVFVNSGAIYEKDGFYSLTKEPGKFSPRLNQDFLLDLKWKKLSQYARWFKHVPFVEFALASGSIAFGNVSPLSDFDVLVGVRDGRMFIGRYCLLALFSLFRVRRPNDKKESGLNKLCFNHFVTENAFAKPPYNTYRQELYRNLVPLWGKREKLGMFFSDNKQLTGLSNIPETQHYIGSEIGTVRRFIEFILSGKFGDWIEKQLARVAKRRLGEYIKSRPTCALPAHAGGRPSSGRVVVSDAELEFHFSLPYEG